MSKKGGRLFRSKLPVISGPLERERSEMEADWKTKETASSGTDDDSVSILSQSLKRKLPAAEFEIESARQKSPPPLQSCPSVSDSKRVSG